LAEHYKLYVDDDDDNDFMYLPNVFTAQTVAEQMRATLTVCVSTFPPANCPGQPAAKLIVNPHEQLPITFPT